METENNINEVMSEVQKSPLYSVTPLSKYLALVLFIVLPFLGGLVGYTYAPERVVEVEKIVRMDVVKEVSISTKSEVQDHQDLVIDPKVAKVGDVFGNFTITSMKLSSLYDEDSIDISFAGNEIVTGEIYPEDMFGPGILFDETSQNVFPAILLNGEVIRVTRVDILGPLVSTLPSEAVTYNGETDKKYKITAELKDYRFYRAPKGVVPTATLVEIHSLMKE